MCRLTMLTAGTVCILACAVHAGNVSAVGGVQTRVPSPLTNLPDLTFASVTVERTTYPAIHIMGSPILVRYFPTPSQNAKARPSSECNRTDSFPVQLVVQNIGQADFVPKDLNQVVGLSIGPWYTAKSLTRLRKGESQRLNFNVSLPPGDYKLVAMINLNNEVAEARGDNNGMAWPLEVKCDSTGLAPAPLNVGFKPGTVIGTIWWVNSVIPRNTVGAPRPAMGLFNGCAGLTVMLGHPTSFGPRLGNLQFIKYSEQGSMAQCQFEFSQVPVDTDLAVGYTVDPGMFKVPVVSPGQSPTFKVPGSGSKSFSVKMELQPAIKPHLMGP